MRTLGDVILQAFVTREITKKLSQLAKDKNIMNFLSGQKTYIMAAAMLVLAGLSFFNIDVPGVGHVDPVAEITAAIGLIFARGGSKTDAAKAVVVANTGAPATTVATAKAQIAQAGK